MVVFTHAMCEVDPARVRVTGILEAGYLTCILAGVWPFSWRAIAGLFPQNRFQRFYADMFFGQKGSNPSQVLFPAKGPGRGSQ